MTKAHLKKRIDRIERLGLELELKVSYPLNDETSSIMIYDKKDGRAWFMPTLRQTENLLRQIRRQKPC